MRFPVDDQNAARLSRIVSARHITRALIRYEDDAPGDAQGEDLTQDRVMRTIAGEGRMETAGALEKEGA